MTVKEFRELIDALPDWKTIYINHNDFTIEVDTNVNANINFDIDQPIGKLANDERMELEELRDEISDIRSIVL